MITKEFFIISNIYAHAVNFIGLKYNYYDILDLK